MTDAINSRLTAEIERNCRFFDVIARWMPDGPCRQQVEERAADSRALLVTLSDCAKRARTTKEFSHA